MKFILEVHRLTILKDLLCELQTKLSLFFWCQIYLLSRHKGLLFRECYTKVNKQEKKVTKKE